MKSLKLNWIWFQPSSRRIGIVQMNGLTRVVDCRYSARFPPSDGPLRAGRAHPLRVQRVAGGRRHG